MYAGSAQLQDVESLDEWEEAGPYYTHQFGKTRKMTENVKVNTQFELNAFANNHRPNLLLFEHFHRKFHMKVQNGMTKEVIADKVN